MFLRWFSGVTPKRSARRRGARNRLSRPAPLGLERLEARQMLSGANPTALAALAAKIPTPDHVVIVIDENHAYNEIIGSSAAPYINSLAADAKGAVFTQYFALEHPSQPNYIELFSGSNQGVTDDSVPSGAPFSTANLGSELLSQGKTFVGYSEDLPSVGFTGATSGDYARKHCPWVNWQGTGTNQIPAVDNQPLTAFPSDFSQLPTLSFVIPNLNDDMHDGTIQEGDSWLQQHLDGYVQWAKTHNSLLIFTFDEDDYTQNNQICTLFVGAMVQHGQYGEYLTHYNTLRTLEDMYGLPYAGQSATAAAISDVWMGAWKGPTVAVPASASPATVPDKSTVLSVLGADADGEAGLAYTWGTTAAPAGAAPVTFSCNGNNAAKSTTATFSKAGHYTFRVTIADAAGLKVTSSVKVAVSQTLSGLTVSPSAAIVGLKGVRQFTASGTDQFGNPMRVKPLWKASVGTITAGGSYHAPAAAAKGTVTAQSGGFTVAVPVEAAAVVPWAAWEFNEDGGTLAGDASGHNHPGTIAGATWTAGPGGAAALHFNGTSSVVTFGPGTALGGKTDFTVSAWIRTTASSAGVIVEQRGAKDVNGGYQFRMNADGTLELLISGKSGQLDVATTGSVNDGQWHLVVAQRQQHTGSIYVDGALWASASGAICPLAATMRVNVGADLPGNDMYFNGDICDVRIYRTAVAASLLGSLAGA
ncbi:MAG: alkaline phosphatase family protein [Thermoguttaceae bacterium]|jgi:hypothetical protein